MTHGGASLAEAYNEAIVREERPPREAHRRLDLLRVEAPFAAALVDEGTLTLDQGIARAEQMAAAPLLDEHVRVIRALGRRMMTDALEIGRRLAECRRYVRNDWEGWLKRELDLEIGVRSISSASMSFRGSDLKTFHLDLPGSAASTSSARPSTSEAIRDDILGRAAAGETISFAEIKREVSGETPAAALVQRAAKLAAQLAEERPDDPLVEQLQALVLRAQ